jgi:hypothetical protein
MLRDGQYLGAVDGIRDWDVYQAELQPPAHRRAQPPAQRGHPGAGRRPGRRTRLPLTTPH